VTGLRRRFPNKISVRFESERRDPSRIGTALGRLIRVRTSARVRIDNTIEMWYCLFRVNKNKYGVKEKMKEALVIKIMERKEKTLFDEDTLKGFLPDIQQAYDIQSPIYEVRYTSDEEGRTDVLFAFCSGKKEDIKKLVDHASSLMGPRDEMVYFYDRNLEDAVKDWLGSLRHYESLIERQKLYMKGTYPRTEDIGLHLGITHEVTKKDDERRLNQLEQRLQFLKETGPVVKVKPSNEKQICPHCLKFFLEGKEQKAS